MAAQSNTQGGFGVLQSKRSATRFQILVQIVEHQPAINQKEIAKSVGLTPQSISEYLQGLKELGHVEKHGRGRYEVTKEGVNWLIAQTKELQELVEYVDREILGETERESAVATDRIREGESVTLSMRESRLHATPGEAGRVTAVAVTSAEPGRTVGVTNVEGILDYEPGTVWIVTVPSVTDSEYDEIDPDLIADRAARYDRVAALGTEAATAARVAGIETDLEFGVPSGVPEAAMKGLDVMVLAVADELTPLVEQLRQHSIKYELVDRNEL
ncbi:DUF7839 domain-containing protein [Halorubrum lipolyticum]|uniref:Regulatory protein Crp n=1 Tax=Halorubrum lipolyticum DSM 21995 TaxID=1227482 RepID=M0NQU3_9EURY|nr:MarR family transcriptional regulator [Halorubrum lipolyticum]EMA59574.1 regulatory protein Crp [Halorubrum lipolyticum DSM 21995]